MLYLVIRIDQSKVCPPFSLSRDTTKKEIKYFWKDLQKGRRQLLSQKCHLSKLKPIRKADLFSNSINFLFFFCCYCNSGQHLFYVSLQLLEKFRTRQFMKSTFPYLGSSFLFLLHAGSKSQTPKCWKHLILNWNVSGMQVMRNLNIWFLHWDSPLFS